jgi:hypothetical protein
MSLTYCGVFLNIMVALLHVDTTSNEYNDLVTLQKIARNQDNDKKVDIDFLLREFRKTTRLKVSLDDLYFYFSKYNVWNV